MNEVINEKVSVVLVYDRQKNNVMPYRLRWQGRDFKITKLGFHHKYRLGRTIQHIFSVTDGNTFFRLRLDTDTLQWTLEEISDGITA